MIKQLPISVSGARKDDVRSQFAALCYRIEKKKIRILLITSRGTRRWIVPKGWPVHGQTPAETAAMEAWEEAGVRGRSDGRCLGIYSYSKDTEEAGEFPCLGMIFPVEVTAIADDYPEAGQRERRWVSRKKAAQMVDEPELARILLDFDPRV
ncbi:NUDIX hydrolase [uncultured Roseobacter sp.]|uniref:NUDIX hydrolase n=1 Tax=uncultured Roseobacter sp. TaxID=114847 RepID=UPI00261D9420|nr:NUDIX hydrolase [uncultured Roseobacter sp.]